ncbi:amino acid permease, partial [Candidatus Uhrbacteria bacterium]|nr:amino acid permease [Candidatus Uhrbacteria bacterium]
MAALSQRTWANLRAGEILVGAMIGVGVFGLPFAFARSGFFVGMVELLLLGLATMSVHLMYAEVALQTPGHHRIVGYFKRYFSKRWAHVAALIFVGGNWGALVAYILVGGDFLHSLFAPWFGGPTMAYQAVFLVFGLLMALGGLRFVAGAEMYLVGLLVLVMGGIIIWGATDIHIEALLTFNGSRALFPYGVVLFSLGGFGAIPQMRDVLGRYRGDLRGVVVKSTSLVMVLYALFAMVVVGVTGAVTTPEALAGLEGVFGRGMLVAGVLMGFLAVATSFLVMSVEIQETFEFDYRWTKILAWFGMMIVPVVIFLLG